VTARLVITSFATAFTKPAHARIDWLRINAERSCDVRVAAKWVLNVFGVSKTLSIRRETCDAGPGNSLAPLFQQLLATRFDFAGGANSPA